MTELPRLEIAPEGAQIRDGKIIMPAITLSGTPLSDERKERMEVADACFERGWILTAWSAGRRTSYRITWQDGGKPTDWFDSPLAAYLAATTPNRRSR